ncbi:serine threonine- kinase endoribonuclease IRE1 [Paramuricea clavata]|uniref:Serine threonine- kinase endoribonuclease IRE1 n=1 Tax=Paramuricea clavata TaxID=317549 RepID=A0A7D9EKK3_PARCT|nr:serine threonine- kinase endoribonuclease IRE1 [Paramuricea clavata]
MRQLYFLTGATTYLTSDEGETHGWVPQECIDWVGLYSDKIRKPSDAPIHFRWKEKSDIQVAGMVAFYIVTKGKHPFGPRIDQLKDLHDDNPVGLSKLSDHVVEDLLSQMLGRDLDERPYVEQALKHPFFLSFEEQMKFVQAVVNEPKFINYASEHRISLLPTDWKRVFGHEDLNTLCRGGHRSPSEYNGSRYTDCLRLIGNTCQHPDGKLRQLKKKTPATSSLEHYFLQLFPTLPLVLHQIIREDPKWKTLPALKEFFPVIDRRKRPIQTKAYTMYQKEQKKIADGEDTS